VWFINRGSVHWCLVRALASHFILGVLAIVFFGILEALINRAGIHSEGLHYFFLITDVSIAVAVGAVTILTVIAECFLRRVLFGNGER
jgi:hypothetical protein